MPSDPQLPKPPPGQTAGGVGEPALQPSYDDAGTQALAEALSSSFKIIRFLMVLLVGLFFLSGMFTVEPNQVAVKLRFGKPVGLGPEQLLKPGWHWAFPYPIEEVVKIPVGQSHLLVSTNGWFFTTPELEALGTKPEPKMSLSPGVDGYTLTGDGNIIHARMHLKYRISDPLNFTFHYLQATNLLAHIVDNAINYASAQFTAEAALYNDKIRFQEIVLDRVRRVVSDLQLGITIETADVETRAPADVQPKFEEVLTAQQEADQKVREAQGYAGSVTNRAAGFAKEIVNNGMNSSNQLVSATAAEAKYLEDQLPYYRTNPRLLRERLLAETRTIVFTNAQEKHVMPAGDAELRLLLSREPITPSKQNGQ